MDHLRVDQRVRPDVALDRFRAVNRSVEGGDWLADPAIQPVVRAFG